MCFMPSRATESHGGRWCCPRQTRPTSFLFYSLIILFFLLFMNNSRSVLIYRWLCDTMCLAASGSSSVISWLSKNWLLSSLPECTKTFFSPHRSTTINSSGMAVKFTQWYFTRKTIWAGWKGEVLIETRGSQSGRQGVLTVWGDVQWREVKNINTTLQKLSKGEPLSKMCHLVREVWWVWGNSTDFLTYPELETNKCLRTGVASIVECLWDQITWLWSQRHPVIEQN